MGINIDTFLEGLDSDKKKVIVNDENKKENEEKIDLSFENELKEKILNLQKSIGEKDFDFLVKAYNEMKNFDETLPNKLFSVNEFSGKALSELSSKYSQGYLKGITANMNTLSASIKENLSRAQKELENNNFQMAMSFFNEAQKNYRLFPKEFVSEKTQVGKELRNVEIIINERFLTYKRDEVKKIKLQVSSELKALRDSLIPSNIMQIEQRLNSINLMLDRTPKVFYSDLVLERTQVSKSMIVAQDFLNKEYERDFSQKKQEIFRLFDKFHKYKAAGDVNNSLITYDEMIILFGKMPDIFLEEKTTIFDRINKVFESLNNLLMSSNLSVFVKTYEYGKTLDEVKDYIEHVNLTKSADLNILINLKKKIGQIPISFRAEVLDIVGTLDKMISDFEKKPTINRNSTNFNPMPQPEEINMDENLVNTNASKDNVKSNIVLEINECYKNLLSAKDKGEAIKFAKKIHFYVDMLKVNDTRKTEIITKVERALKMRQAN